MAHLFPTRGPTPAPPSQSNSAPPSAVDPWIGEIIFSLVFVAFLGIAGYYYKYRSDQNEKQANELRIQLKELLDKEGMPQVKEAPFTLHVDASQTPLPVLPEGGDQKGHHGSRRHHGGTTGSSSKKRSKKNRAT